MLVLPRRAYDEIIDHAVATAPREACGILAGRQEDGRRVVATVHRMVNVADAPRLTYEMDPEEQFRTMEAIEARDRSVLGFYHSHPAGPSVPSETDERRATWADHAYVVVSLGRSMPTFDAWTWTEDGFVQEDVSVRS